MFGIDAPAENISVLTQWLKKTHRPDFLYRGQTKDYAVMVPSFYRHIVADLSDPAPIAKIEPDRLDALSPQALVRLGILRRLVQIAGVGFGNIIAQQYGITSETLDVTESIDVASFFATRRYPTYAQVEDGIGVIYRFDSTAERRLSAPFQMSDLDDLFERGKSHAGFFDFFVQKRSMSRIFDRDRWFGFAEGEEQIVSTISFATSWRDLRDAVHSHRAERREHVDAKKDGLADAIETLDWDKTRFAGQSGGFLRPEIYWEAMVPKNFTVVNTRAEMARAYGAADLPHPDLNLSEKPGPIRAFPLIVPSSAIKQTAVGVENIRSRPDCQAFFFKHGTTRAAPIIRHNLWPEPSEDPLYGALWQAAIDALMVQHYPNHIPPVDDPDQGVLDRGYRVAGEAATRNSRNFDDLYRGQLEDVNEAITSFGPTSVLYAAKGEALSELGQREAALKTFATGLRRDRTDANLLLGLAQLFRSWGKPNWGRQVVEYARAIHSENLRLIEVDASLYLDAFEFGYAGAVVENGLAIAKVGSIEWGRLVFYRIVTAELTDDLTLSRRWRDAAEKYHVEYESVDDIVRQMRTRFRRPSE